MSAKRRMKKLQRTRRVANKVSVETDHNCGSPSDIGALMSDMRSEVFIPYDPQLTRKDLDEMANEMEVEYRNLVRASPQWESLVRKHGMAAMQAFLNDYKVKVRFSPDGVF